MRHKVEMAKLQKELETVQGKPEAPIVSAAGAAVILQPDYAYDLDGKTIEISLDDGR